MLVKAQFHFLPLHFYRWRHRLSYVAQAVSDQSEWEKSASHTTGFIRREQGVLQMSWWRWENNPTHIQWGSKHHHHQADSTARYDCSLVLPCPFHQMPINGSEGNWKPQVHQSSSGWTTCMCPFLAGLQKYLSHLILDFFLEFWINSPPGGLFMCRYIWEQLESA